MERHLTFVLFLLVEVLSTIWASCLHKAEIYWSIILEVRHWMSAILNDNERPLSDGSKGFRKVDMRKDLRFDDALMR